MRNPLEVPAAQHLRDLRFLKPSSPRRLRCHHLMTGKKHNSPWRIYLWRRKRCFPPREMLLIHLCKTPLRRHQRRLRHLKGNLQEGGRHQLDPCKVGNSIPSTGTQRSLMYKYSKKCSNIMRPHTGTITRYKTRWRIHWLTYPACTQARCNLIKPQSIPTARNS